MGVATMRVPTIFTAVDRFSGVVSRMTAGTAAFGQTAQAAAMRTSRKFNSAGTTMLYTGAAIATGLGLAVNEAMKYEKAVASLAAVTGTETGAMNSQIEGLAKDSKRSAIEVAKSFEIVGSKMSEYLDNPEALKKITGASILMAEAANMKLEPAIESLTGVLNIFGKSAEDANYLVNKLSAGEIVGSISIQETADVLRQFGATARLANVEVDESVALIQALTKSLGIEGVGRGIRNLMVDLNMVGAFDKNKTKALQKAGVDMSVLGNKSLDLVTRLKELKKLEGNSAAMGMFFKKTGIQTGATLFQNFDDYERFLLAIQNTNKAQEQADKNNNTLAVKLRRLKDSVSNMAIKLGDELLPKISAFVDKLIPAIQSTTEWAKKNEGLATFLGKTAVALLALGVAAKIGAVLFYGVAKAIQFARFVTIAATSATTLYNGVMLTWALTGQSFTTILRGMAAAQLASLGPIALVVGALGALAIAYKIVSDATHKTMYTAVDSYKKSDASIKYSTIVMKDEFDKQYDLMLKQRARVDAFNGVKNIADVDSKNEFYNMNASVISAKVSDNPFIDERKKMSRGFFDNLKSNMYGSIVPNFAGDETMATPKNLSGQSDVKYRLPKIGGELKVSITTDKGSQASVDSSNVKGIAVKTGSTSGSDVWSQ